MVTRAVQSSRSRRIARQLLVLAALLLTHGHSASVRADATTETRDPREYFFTQTFGDLPDEIEDARRAGRLGLMLFFEQEGCIYCERMMKTVLNQPAVQDWYREHFISIAVDINGDVELRDVDAVTLPSKVFAEHRRVKTTPTISFIGLDGAEVFRRVTMVSSPEEFLAMGQYVAEGRYMDTPWRDYAAKNAIGNGQRAPIPQARNLQGEGAAAAAAGKTILLAVTREGCPYCAVLRREVLSPMILGGEYAARVSIIEMKMEPASDVVDFSGQNTTTADVAARYGIEITPTVLLLDSSGRPLVPPITGINNVDMYGYYLDEAIAKAIGAVAGR